MELHILKYTHILVKKVVVCHAFFRTCVFVDTHKCMHACVCVHLYVCMVVSMGS
jgi:hypothetical protein